MKNAEQTQNRHRCWQWFLISLITCLFVSPISYLLSPICLYSASFKILGTRPLSMGGAYVAIGEDAITQYWNPAGLGIGKDIDFQIPVGVQVEITGDLLGSADRISDIADQYADISKAQEDGKAMSLDQVSAFVRGVKELNELNDPAKGILADISAGGNIRVGNYAFSLNNFTSIGIDPTIDLTNLGLGGGTFSPQLKRAVSKATNYDGLDLGAIVDDYNVDYLAANGTNIYDAPSDASLAASANTLASGIISDIMTELTNLGIDTTIVTSIGGLTIEQALANAIVNAASDQTIAGDLGTTVLTAEQIAEYVRQIEEVRPLVVGILKNATSGTSYAANQSNLTIRGISMFEASLGYGMKAPYVQSTAVLGGLLKGLFVGANLKYIKGYVGYVKVQMLSDDDVDVYDDFNDNKTASSNFGLDLGFLLQKKFFGKKTHFGLLFRNINSPSFDQPANAQLNGEGSDYDVDAQIRGGVAFWPFNWWTVSMDMDLTENSTPLPGYKSRLWGLGNEFNILNKSWLNLALRGGLMQNIAESSAKMAYTLGFGLNLFHFVIDAGGAMSTDSVEIGDGTKIPSSAAGAITISFDF